MSIHSHIHWLFFFFCPLSGIFPEARDITMKWVIVKGVSSFADGSISTNESWKTFACCMAASLISSMLDDSVIFEDWPHYGGM